MKYVVRVAEKSYEVEIEDINARPVIARVDGQAFEVSPENGTAPKPALGEVKEIKTETHKPMIIEPAKPVSSPSVNSSELTAPLPGTVIEIFMKAGDYIESGQVVLIIEAMKMKNSIRSTRPGRIAQVLVDAGQTVAHKQPLVKFEN